LLKLLQCEGPIFGISSNLFINATPKLLIRSERDCLKVIRHISIRDILDINEEFTQSHRQELDNIIFDILGLTKGERDAVYEAVIELVNQRFVKARSV
jgi:hypothetical protein